LNAGLAYELKATLEFEFQEVPSTSLKQQILQQARTKWVELGFNDEKKRLEDLKTLTSQQVPCPTRAVSSPPHLPPPQISAIHKILRNQSLTKYETLTKREYPIVRMAYNFSKELETNNPDKLSEILNSKVVVLVNCDDNLRNSIMLHAAVQRLGEISIFLLVSFFKHIGEM
jgi:hypothetical protein